MDLDAVGKKLDAFLYRRIFQKLTKDDLENAKTWCLTVIHQNHPSWTDTEIQKYYDSLLNVKVLVVDEWGRRMK